MNDPEMLRAENARLRALLEEGVEHPGPVRALTAADAHWRQRVREALEKKDA